MELDRVQLLRSALTDCPGLREANRALADHYRDLHARAERSHDHAEALRHEVLLRAHDDGTFADYLKGTGRVWLETDPSGARVTAHRLSLSDNALQPGAGQSLGRTPLAGKELPMGSYILEINAPGRLMVRYPVLVERQGRVLSRAPGERSERSIVLPKPRALTRDEVLVPAGWYVSGGDPEAQGSLPRRRVWIEDLVARVTPVSNRDYLGWLNALVERGETEQALAFAPRQHRRRTRESDQDIIYSRTPEGLFELADGFWQLDWPVVLITWPAAAAYARWLSESEGKRWRLPSELEWEKLARGVDSRAYPWGEVLDPSFACVEGSHEGRDRPAAVRDFPWDTSPYGVRGLGGNVQDWCADPFRPQGPNLEFGRVVVVPEVESSGPRVVRGGHWQARPAEARICARTHLPPNTRSDRVGFRLVRTPG